MIVFASDPLESSEALAVTVPIVPTKICSGCGSELPATEFRPKKGKNVGRGRRRAECRACEWEQRRQNRARKRAKAMRQFAAAAARANSVRQLRVLAKAILVRMGGLQAFVESTHKILDNASQSGKGLREALNLNMAVVNILAVHSRPLDRFTDDELEEELMRRES